MAGRLSSSYETGSATVLIAVSVSIWQACLLYLLQSVPDGPLAAIALHHKASAEPDCAQLPESVS